MNIWVRHYWQRQASISKKKNNRLYNTKKHFLKTVAFIAGKKNPAVQKFFMCFSIESLIANISFYALSWPKLNFGCYLTFKIIFKALFQQKNE